jgi:hypothetical protein
MTPREELMALRRMAELEAKAAGQSVPQPKQQPVPEVSEIPAQRQQQATGSLFPGMRTVGNIAAGAVGGAGAIGSTLVEAGKTVLPEALGGQPASTFTQRLGERNAAIRQALQTVGAEPESLAYKGGELGAQIAGTMGAGGVIAAPVKAASAVAPRLAPLATALQTGGMGAAGAATKGGEIAARLAGGAGAGAGSAALINPNDITTGAMVGAALPVAGAAIGKGAKAIVDLRGTAKNKAAEIARQTLGADLPQVVNALRNTPANAGVGEATAFVQNPAWQALLKDSLETTPEGAQYLNKLGTMTDKQAINELAKLAGGATAAQTRATAEAAKEAARGITTPMREAALDRANLGKEVARLEGLSAELGEQASTKVQEVRRLMELGDLANANARLGLIKRNLPVGLTKYTYSGELAERAFNDWSNKAATASLDLGQGARFAQEAADTLRSSGIKPLESESLIRNLRSTANNPEFAGNDVLLGALRNVSEDIAKWTDNGGIIDARALDAIRKNSVNAAVAQLRPGMDATSQRNAAAGVLGRIKPVIDDAIEQAGGTGYRDYLKQHAQLSQKIAEKQLTGEALDLYKTNKDAFVRLVQNESPDTVEKILGPGKYNIAMELATDTLDVLEKEAKSHLARVASSKQATEGQKALATVIEQNTSRFRIPSFLNFWATTSNKALAELQEKIGIKTTNILSKAAQNPQAAADLLESLPASERLRVLNAIKNSTRIKPAVQQAARILPISNAMAPQPESENALIGR